MTFMNEMTYKRIKMLCHERLIQMIIYQLYLQKDKDSMLKPLFEESKHCIQCGNKVQKGYIQLAHFNYIDKQCLAFIQMTTNNCQGDQDMLLYYQYILSLVVNCHKCNAMIDGTIKKRVSQPNAPSVCHLCGPAKKENQKAPQFCALCNKQLNDKVFKDTPIEVSGLIICQKCYGYQVKGMEETKEKEEKPDFGDFAIKTVFMPERQQPKKEEIIPKHSFESFFNTKQGQNSNPSVVPMYQKQDFIPKKQQVVHSKSSKNLTFSNKPPSKKEPFQNPKHGEQFQFPLQDLFSDIPSKKKDENKRCSNCYKIFFHKQIKDRKVNVDLCNGCHIASCKFDIKNEERKDEDDAWDLFQLFSEVPKLKAEVKIEEKKYVPYVPPPVKKQEKTKQTSPQIQINLDNINYDLKGCKICFNATASMINNKCRHLMMCDTCYRQMQNRQKIRNDTMPCPYCASVGKYTRYIEPIYI